jgi:CHAT domain-containing protein
MVRSDWSGADPGDLLRRYELTAEVAFLMRAIALLRSAAATAQDRRDRSVALAWLSRALLLEFMRKGDARMLAEAVAVSTEAVEISPDHPDRFMLLGYQCEVLQARYRVTGDPVALEDALEAARNALAATPPHGRNRALSSLRVVALLRLMVLQNGDLSALADAMALCDDALAEIGPDPEDLAAARGELAVCLRLRFRLTGDTAALDQALRHIRAALEVTPQGGPNRVGRRLALADILWFRYKVTEELATLVEAVELLRQVEAETKDNPERGNVLFSLGNALFDLGERTGRTDLLEESLQVSGQAVALLPPGSRFWVDARSRYSLSLLERHRRTGDPDDLAKSIEVMRTAIGRATTDQQNAGTALMQFGFALLFEYERSGDRRALRRAVATARQALDRVPAGNPQRDRALYFSALLLSTTGKRRTVGKAVRLLREAAELDTGNPGVRVLAAHAWGLSEAVAGRHQPALTAFRLALDLLPRTAPRSLARIDQEYGLSTKPGLASDAAACALANRDPVGALELLEHGRGLLLSYGLDARGDLERLRHVRPDLAEEIEQLRRLMDPLDPPIASGTHDLSYHHKMSAQWDELTGQVRRVAGFEQFLRKPVWADLRPEDPDDRVIVVNASPIRCDALLLTEGEVRPVPLPGLMMDELTVRSDRFRKVQRVVGDPHASLAEQNDAENELRALLGWLWDVAAAPILDALDLTRKPGDTNWPHLWWVPTGRLALLPLHAAGYHEAGAGEALMDRAVSSYAPTVRVLRHLRALPRMRAEARILAVSMAQTEGMPPLPWAAREAADLAARLPGVQLLSDATATATRVLLGLSGHEYVHFACHAESDPLSPSRSRLLLHDGDLPVTRIGGLRLDGAELAYLSACSTAQTGVPELADEAIHIASAFQLAGFRHVVGTLWPTNDKAAAQVANKFYERLLATARPDPAAILHEVIRERRDRAPSLPRNWAGFVHAGP